MRNTLRRLFRKPRDPELVLKQTIRDLEDRVPELNENLAMIAAEVTLVERELTALVSRECELAKRGDPEERALLGQVRREIPHQRAQLAIAEKALVKAQGIKRAFMLDKERKIRVAKDALSARRAVEWQRQAVSALTDMERALLRAEPAALPSFRELEEEARVSERQFLWTLERLDESLESYDRGAVAERVASLRSFLRGEELRVEARLAGLRESLARWEEREAVLDA